MGSASEDIRDQSEDARSKTTPSTGKPFSLDVGLQFLTSVQGKDQFIPGDDYAPKVRKQYTITKQRERWTEEEHKKFLEALKLYGRAWRRIEEHVGTKTAVQIRSHAQKFFSKVVRESSSNEESIVKPIEIPPPRPKRKPMHPYPRKMVSLVKTGGRLSDEHRRSASPNLSISGQENQSPTSVLSALGSDTTGVTDSNMPNGSSSPDSSAADDQPKGLFPSEAIPSPVENGPENGSSSPTHENNNLTQYDQVPTKLELFPEVGAFVKEDSTEVASTQSLKLFGKTVIVVGPSSSNSRNCNSQPPEETDERPVQTSSWNLTPGVKFTPTDAECCGNGLSCGAPALHYMQFQNENSDSVEAASGPSLPCWTFYGGVSYPFLQLHNSVPEKEYVYSDGNKVKEYVYSDGNKVQDQDKGVQKDGSRTGSNSGSVNARGDGDKTWDVETQSRQPFFVKEESEQKPKFMFKPKDEVALPEKKANKAKCLKGFVPYKRCLAERGSSSTLTGEEREEQRMRL